MLLLVGYIMWRISALEWLEIVNHVTRITRHIWFLCPGQPRETVIAHGSPLSHHFK
jgi:hypothetical protein